MPDITANIVLQTTGGDSSAAEINKAGQALENVTRSSGHMEGAFQHRFQHIGLMLFAGDALRASGLGAETRQVIGGLNTALMAGEAAFGAAAGPAFLLVAALGALAGIAIKVIEHHKDMIVQLDKEAKTITDSLKPHQDIIEALERYQKAGLKLTDQQKDLLTAERVLADDMKSNLTVVYRNQLTEIEKQIAANMTHANTMHMVHAATEALLKVWTTYLNLLKSSLMLIIRYVPEWNLLARGIQKVVSALDHYKSNVQLSSSETAELTKKNDALKAKYQEIIDQINHLGKTTKDYYDESSKAAEESFSKQAKIAEEVTKKIGQDFGNAVAKMIVEGKDFTEEFTQAFTKMAEQIIEKIVQMIAEWAIFTAMTGFGGPVGALGSAGLQSIGFASGGEMVADRPTMVMFGEAGPERATFTPLSGGAFGGSPGSGGDTYNISLTMNANGITDPDKLARTMGNKLVQMIRGQGQLSMVRS